MKKLIILVMIFVLILAGLLAAVPAMAMGGGHDGTIFGDRTLSKKIIDCNGSLQVTLTLTAENGMISTDCEDCDACSIDVSSTSQTDAFFMNPIATNIKVTDTINPIFSISSVVPSKGNATVTGNKICWSVDKLGGHSNETVTLTYTLTLVCSQMHPCGLQNTSLSTTYSDNEMHAVSFPILCVYINNSIPVVDAGPDLTLCPGKEVSICARFTDPCTCDKHTAVIDWGDGQVGPGQVTEANGSGTVKGSHIYAGNTKTWPVKVTVTDNCGAAGCDALLVKFRVVPLTVNAGQDRDVLACNQLCISATFNDPCGCNVHTAVIDWGDGTIGPGQVKEWNGSGKVEGCHIYTGCDATRCVKVKVTSSCGSTGCDTFQVHVINLPPVVVAGPDQTIFSGEQVCLASTFTDPNICDTHTAVIDWGDGTIEQGQITESNGSGTVEGCHIYPACDAGCFGSGQPCWTITVTVSDECGSGQASQDSLDIICSPCCEIIIDIDPGCEPDNPIYVGKKLYPVYVVIYGSECIPDVHKIDFKTVDFEGAKWVCQIAYKDDNGDGIPDVLLTFHVGDTHLVPGQTTATITGTTIDGRCFTGTGDVIVR